jgi:CO/xanthine dehydrogenase FAD-binding subunit
MATSLEPHHVIREVVLPTTESLQDYVRFTPSSPDHFPTMSIAARLDVATDQPLITLGLGGLADTPLHIQRPAFDPSDEDSMRHLVADISSKIAPVDDELGSAAYKAWVAGVWAQRIIGRLLSQHGRVEP